jgi:hypothetical protein
MALALSLWVQEGTWRCRRGAARARSAPCSRWPPTAAAAHPRRPTPRQRTPPRRPHPPPRPQPLPPRIRNREGAGRRATRPRPSPLPHPARWAQAACALKVPNGLATPIGSNRADIRSGARRKWPLEAGGQRDGRRDAVEAHPQPACIQWILVGTTVPRCRSNAISCGARLRSPCGTTCCRQDSSSSGRELCLPDSCAPENSDVDIDIDAWLRGTQPVWYQRIRTQVAKTSVMLKWSQV